MKTMKNKLLKPNSQKPQPNNGVQILPSRAISYNKIFKLIKD